MPSWDFRPSDPPTPKSEKNITVGPKSFRLAKFFGGGLSIFGFEGRRVRGSEVPMFSLREVGVVTEKT